MKRVVLTLLAIVLVVAALAAAGMTGYRYGYAQGVAAESNGAAPRLHPGFGPERMPGHNFRFDREFRPGGFRMLGHGGMGFGFFGPLLFLLRISFWGLVIWAIYTLIVRSGWRITRVATEPATKVAPPPEEPKG